MSKEVRLDIYEGVEATVNAYIISDSESIILIDCLRNSREAALLAAQIGQLNKSLTYLLITHGHPDHYLGMNVIKQEFPEVNIVVASEEIKQDIAGFSAWMQNVGWLETQPAMKPLAADNPAGFDYQGNIGVLKTDKISLADGAVMKIKSDYQSAEAAHLTTIYSEDLNAFFCSDFCYHGVHPWLAIDRQHIADWKRQLDELYKTWKEKSPTVYPGHGKPGDVELFEEVGDYISDFENTIATSKSRAEAMSRMTGLYPNHTQADFLLLYSVNAFIEK